MTSMKERRPSSVSGTQVANHGYASVNGLEMYYQIEGTGDPLTFIHPALGFAGLESFPNRVERQRLSVVMQAG